MSKPHVAFLGLGIMGSGMAGQVLRAGFPLTVFNRTASRANDLVKAGATLASSPREAVRSAQIVVCMVGDDEASRAMWLGDNGALAGVSQGATLIESSTLTLEWIRQLHSQASDRGCELVDAPVTGSKGPAQTGQLNFLVGGTPGAIDRARPVLEVMGKSITHLGPSGSGSLLKLINNFVCGVQAAAIAEAMAWVERAGLDASKAMPIMVDGAPGSPMVKAISSRAAARDYAPNFELRWMAKDLRYAIAESPGFGLKLKTAPGALDLFNDAVNAGNGQKDLSAVIEPLRKGK